jgi:hypothetical protein
MCDALAAQAVPAQPLSIAAHAGPASAGPCHDTTQPDACCAAIEEAVLVKPAYPSPGAGADARGVSSTPRAAFDSAAAVPAVRADAVPYVIPPPKSFYARSARIRR